MIKRLEGERPQYKGQKQSITHLEMGLCEGPLDDGLTTAERQMQNPGKGFFSVSATWRYGRGLPRGWAASDFKVL
jgi:hypothetical protein